MTRAHQGLLLLAAAAALVAGCRDAADKAAKQRIFSAEEPPHAKLAASQPIDVDKVADDAALTWRVLTMKADEAFERIGAFRYEASASFQWSGIGANVSLAEKRTLEQASAAEFILHTENDRDAGLDVVRLSDRTFARSRYHKFRERKRDRGQAELLREDVFGALRSAESILSNRLALSRDQREEVNGRGARRFQLMIAKDALTPVGPDRWKLPPLKYPQSGADPSTRRRADFANLRTPKSVEGSLWVDIETGVPLKVELTAVVLAPGEDKDQATLTLKITSELKPVPGKLALAAPDDYLPDQDRPNGIAAALERFEVQRPDGGVAVKPAEGEEPAEE